MAREFLGDKLEGPNGTVSERTARAESEIGYKSPFAFEPMRRKMRLEARGGGEANAVLE